MKRIAPVQMISFLVLIACGALCQSARPSADSLQGGGSHSPDAFLPDAPLVQPADPAESHPFVDESVPRSPGAVAVNVDVARKLESSSVPFGPQVSLAAPDESVLAPRNPSIFFDKYLYPSLRRGELHYHPSTSNSFVGRAAYAASRFFVTRDDSGKGKLNTSYLLGVLTSVAIATAYRPYWARSPSTTFKAFGSTIGSDAGVNLFHEFGPGIRQMVKSRTPKFVSRIEERIIHDQTPRDVGYTPAR